MKRALALLLAMLPLAAAAEPPDGRALFHGVQPFAAGLATTDRRLPAAYAACANCHGPLGEGGREGGSIIPPIGRAALFRPQGDQPAYPSAAAVTQAILAGTGRDGRSLAAIMPRYRLEPAELAALLDYLGRVGTAADLPPGVTATGIALGTVLPLTGEAAPSGRAILAGLQDVLGTVAAQGGVHGRRIDLSVADGAALGPEGAVRRLLAQPVYAFVGGLWPAGTPADAALAAARVPHIGSLVVRAEPGDAGPWTADLLPPVAAQRAALARSLDGCTTAGPRLALRFGEAASPPGDGIAWLAGTTALAAALRDAAGPGCLGLDLGGLARLGSGLPPGWQVLLVLPFPAALLGDGVPPDPWRQLGRAAARLAVEWLARAGARLHEGALPAQLAGSQGFEPLPGAAVRYGRHRRHAWDAEVTALTDRGG